jgi:dolichyl-diphosphooligosaccharide--protein glycosyltransferase
VPGAVIKRNGIIEVNVITNNNRIFICLQTSVDGQFVVPDSTTDNSYNVKTTGTYTIIDTGETFEISNEAVIRGLTIN